MMTQAPVFVIVCSPIKIFLTIILTTITIITGLSNMIIVRLIKSKKISKKKKINN